MKKFNPNKNIIITLIIIIIVVIVVSLTTAQRINNGKSNIIQSAVNDSVGFVDKTLSFPMRMLGNGLSSISGLINTYTENEKLKEKIDGYGQIATENENYKKENEVLKKELELNATLSDFEKITATAITRSPDTWQDLVTIDKGENDGIEPNMAVMSQKGLVGRVIEVNNASSKVELLTSTNQTSTHFPVQITSGNGESFGLMKSYDEKKNMLVVSQLTGDADIKEGDLVQTSGLGGNSPANLAIGKVEKIKPDTFGLDKEVYVKPYSDMYNLPVVTVIKRSVGNDS